MLGGGVHHTTRSSPLRQIPPAAKPRGWRVHARILRLLTSPCPAGQTRQNAGTQSRLVLLLVAAALLLLAIPDSSRAASIIVARIDGTPIYRATYDEVLQRANYDAATTPQERQQIAAKVMEELINEQLLSKLLTDNGVEVKTTEVDAMVANLRGQLATRQQSFESFLADSGRTEAVLRKQMATELGLNKLLVPRLTESRLQDFFDQRKQEFDGTRLRVSHLVLRPDSAAGEGGEDRMFTKAAEIRAAILAGELTFSEAVRRYSAGQSRLQDGDMGFIPRHGLVHEAFATAAFGLEKGEVSAPFMTPFGVHLVTVTDAQVGRGSFGAARGEVQKQLAAELLKEMLAQQRASTEVVYSPGIPHFANSPGSSPGPSREVVVEPQAEEPSEATAENAGQ